MNEFKRKGRSILYWTCISLAMWVLIILLAVRITKAEPIQPCGSIVENDAAEYCHNRYKTSQFNTLTPDGKERLINVCIIHQQKLK